MLDSMYVYIRRFKWDVQFYVRYMWRDVMLCTFFIICGVSLGIVVAINIEVVKECVIVKLINGTYSSFGTFIKVMLYTFCTLMLIAFSGFCKIYHIIHYMIIFYWGYRFGMDIISITTVFIGFMSLLFIYIPYYIFTISLFISMILYIRITLPNPRPNWWCYSRCMMNRFIRRCTFLCIPACIINIVVFIINPVIIQIFTIVI